MSKITLINPKYSTTSGATLAPFQIPPLSLMKCAWLLKEQGHSVEIKDFQVSKESMLEWAVRCNADIVIVSTGQILNWQCPQSDISELDRLLSILRNRKQNIKLIGPHLLLTDFLHKYGEVLSGEPEGYMFDLKTKRDWDFSSTEKLYVNNPTDYFFPVLGNRVMTFEAIRGCSVGCDFCFQGMYITRKKALPNLISEIKEDVKAGYRRFFNVDLNFSLDPKYMEAFADGIAVLGIKWGAHATLTGLKNIDLEKLRKSGCEVLMVGIENRHQRGLPNKNVNEEFVSKMIKKIRDSKIKVGGYFILGCPNETKEDVLDTISYAKSLKINYASFQLFHPLKGTEAFSSIAENVVMNKYGLSEKYQGEIDHDWLLGMQKKAFWSFYFRPTYFLDNIGLLFKPRMGLNGIASIIRLKWRIQ
ncbi:MAG: radical SAM protein [Flavobacteriales bacterium]|nr:radical SAM protein [Flavobacteriales bacterium]